MVIIKRNVWMVWILKNVLTESGQVKVDNGRDTVVSSAVNNKYAKPENVKHIQPRMTYTNTKTNNLSLLIDFSVLIFTSTSVVFSN